jgi:tetratricopeptide (TPR) repeat protein/GR25 family glycosyltransferase involved in LPS biosynthesis
MDIHLINLDRNEDRLSTFMAANRHLNNIARFPAVDGVAMSRGQLCADGIFSSEMPAYSDGGVGCALSHLTLWQKVAGQSEAVTIAEDDTIFNVHFEAEASALVQSLPPDWDILLWGWNFDSVLLFDFLPGISPCLATFAEPEMRRQAAVFRELHVKPQAYRLQKAFGAMAYTVSPQGARKLLKHCLPIREMDVYCPGLDLPVTNSGIDVMMNALYAEINAFVSFPPLAVSKNEKAISTVNRQEKAAGPTTGESADQALEIDPNDAAAHIKLGNALRARGQFDDAIAHYQKAVDIKPDHAGVQVNLANALQARGKFDLAIAHYEKALHIDPGQAVIFNNLGGAILGAQGKLDDAAACFEQAIALNSDYVDAHNNLAHVRRAQGNLDAAAACYQRAITLRSDRPDFHNELGKVLREQGKLDAAVECYERALALNPNYAEAHYNLGNVFGDQGRLDDAIECYERTLALQPDYADAHTNLIITLRDLGRVDDAMACCQQALEADPDSAVANFCDGFLRLLTGDFVEGWPKYEWRWRTKEVQPHGLTAPLWDGQDLRGRSILLHCEQGLGDSIQAIRFARLVKEKHGTVLLSCPPSLTRLFQDVAGIDGIFPDGLGLPDYDVQAPLMSLPGLFETDLNTIPTDVPYLLSDPTRVNAWKSRLADYGGFRVGIVWRGSPTHDCHRLMTAAQFAEFLDIPGIAVISLQKDATAEEIETLGHLPGPCFDAGPFLEDFSDTAALIANLDLVISVCTSVCHLAGALAAPVWTLIPFAADWRWLLQREDSPWYPTMRLFRQPKIGDWQSVIERVRAELNTTPKASEVGYALACPPAERSAPRAAMRHDGEGSR